MTHDPALVNAVKLIDELADRLLTVQCRGLAVQRLLVQKGLISEEELAHLMSAMADEAELAIELDPEGEAFRRARQAIREAGGEEPPPPNA